MKKILMVLLSVMILGACSSQKDDEFVVGVIQWATHPALDDSYEGMVKGLEAKNLTSRIKVIRKNANGLAPDANQIADQFVRDKVDVIFAIATPAAQSAMNAVEGTDIPVIFSAVSDAVDAGLLKSNEKPDGQVSGVSDSAPLKKHLELMKEVIPTLKSVGVLFNTGERNSQLQIEQLHDIAPGLGITIVDKGVSEAGDIGFAAQQLSEETDAMYIITDNLIAGATGLVSDQSSKNGKGVFMAEDGQFDQGVLASDSISYLNLGEKAGLMVGDLLLKNKTIAELPVQHAVETTLMVSQKMADLLGIEFPQSVLDRAVIR